jgi:protein required for attachment to host cells
MKEKTWIVLTNTNLCKIYDYIRKDHQLIPIKELEHPQSKAKGTEILSDRPGHYKTRSATRGTYEPRTDSKEVEVEKFIHEIADELESARNLNLYHHLVLIAPPHCIGLLNKYLNDQVKNKITTTLNREYVNLSEHDLKLHLQEHWDDLTKPSI